MTPLLLIADAGPLFSLAAGDLLGALERFSLTVTDVVKQETFDKGLLPNCSLEAQRLLAFYNRHAAHIRVVQTQVGVHVAAQRKRDPHYKQPRNLGELSIHSYLIELRVVQPDAKPVVLFEDRWFTDNASSMPLGILISTEAFLHILEKSNIIKSSIA